MPLDPDRIRRLAEADDDTIPPMTEDQARAALRLLAAGSRKPRLSRAS